MARRGVVLLAFLCALVAAQCGLVAWAAPTARAAQDAPDLGDGLPAGIDLTTLASGVTETLPEAPAHLRFERMTMEPGAEEPLRPAPGPELLYVESGTFLIADELGLEGAYSEGTQLFLPAGVSYAIRNDDTEAATLLRLTLIPPVDAEDADTSASPRAGATPVATLSEVRLEADLTSLPTAPARLFLASVSYEAGADLGRTTFAGPIGLVVEGGTLSVAGPSGIEGQLAPGRSIVLPAGVPNRQRNVGDESAEVLMVGIIPADAGLTAPVAADPAPTPTAEASGASRPEVQVNGTELLVDGARYFFDRRVPVELTGMAQVAEGNGALVFAEDDQGPFDRVYLASDQGANRPGRYFAELPVGSDGTPSATAPCPADAGAYAILPFGEAEYSYAGTEPNLTADQLEVVTCTTSLPRRQVFPAGPGAR